MAVLSEGLEDMGVVMSQFWSWRLRIWGLSRRSLRPGCVYMEVVMSQCWVGRLRIWVLLRRSFRPGG